MTADAETFAPPRAPRREIPYWLIAAVLLAVLFLWLITADADYRIILGALAQAC
jgi:polar amino acid transport system permease protein